MANSEINTLVHLEGNKNNNDNIYIYIYKVGQRAKLVHPWLGQPGSYAVDYLKNYISTHF